MIKEFQREYRWLSNFAKVEVYWDNKKFPSVENAYQAAKNDDIKWHELCQTQDEYFIKKASHGIKIRKDWNIKKEPVMFDLLNQKYSQEPFLTKLLDTNNLYLQQGNTHDDKFWGFCLKTNKGENRLGKMIMEIRERKLGEWIDNQLK